MFNLNENCKIRNSTRRNVKRVESSADNLLLLLLLLLFINMSVRISLRVPRLIL